MEAGSCAASFQFLAVRNFQLLKELEASGLIASNPEAGSCAASFQFLAIRNFQLLKELEASGLKCNKKRNHKRHQDGKNNAMKQGNQGKFFSRGTGDDGQCSVHAGGPAGSNGG